MIGELLSRSKILENSTHNQFTTYYSVSPKWIQISILDTLRKQKTEVVFQNVIGTTAQNLTGCLLMNPFKIALNMRHSFQSVLTIREQIVLLWGFGGEKKSFHLSLNMAQGQLKRAVPYLCRPEDQM